MEKNDKLLDLNNKIQKLYHENVSIHDIENSLNSALINNMNSELEKYNNTITFYKCFSCFLVILSISLVIMLIILIIDKV